MKTKKRKFWPTALFGAVAVLLAGLSSGSFVQARGGGRGGGGGGRGGRGGGGGGGRGVSRRGGGDTGRNGNNERKKAQQQERRDNRLARVAAARLEYAKRERLERWDSDAKARMGEMMGRVLDGSTE